MKSTEFVKTTEFVITESPVHIDSNGHRWPGTLSYSDNTLARDFTRIGEWVDVTESILYEFWMHNNRANAAVTYKINDMMTGEIRNAIPTNIIFKPAFAYPNCENPMFVQYVTSGEAAAGKGLASRLYIELAKNGYSMVSDETQFNGGKALWKRLARISGAHECVVAIWDELEGDWLRDAVGAVVEYDASNLDDSVIWHKIMSIAENRLLVLMSKGNAPK